MKLESRSNHVTAECWESKKQLRRMDKLEQKIKTGLYDIHVS